MALHFQTKLALGTAVANSIAHSQSPGAAGPLTLVHATNTLDVPRRILLTSGSNDTSIPYTITGTNRNGNPLKETINGGNPTAYTTQDFLTVTSIVAGSTGPAGTIEAGTNGIASSAWWNIDRDVNPISIGVGVVVSGTINYTVEYTYDDPNAPFTGTFPTVFAVAALTSQTGNLDSLLTYPVFAIRVTQNSFTNPATVAMIARQAVITPS